LASLQNINDIPRFIRIGQPFNMQVQVSIDGKPSNNATVNYYLSNSSGNVAISGIAKQTPGTIGKFTVDLKDNDTQRLSPGPNTIRMFAASPDAYKPDIVSKTIIAIKPRAR
jgi:hypothetical protein